MYTRRNRLSASITVLLIGTQLMSCASKPYYVDWVPPFERVALIHADVFIAVGGVESHSDRAGKGAGYGSAAGVTGGALIGAMGCGPLLYGTCVVGIATVGMLAGAAGGALYGFSGMSEQDKLALSEALSRIGQNRNFQKDIREKLREEVPELWSPLESADLQVFARIISIELEQHTGDDIQLKTTGSLTFAWEDEKKGSIFSEITFEAISKEQDIDLWLADDGVKFEKEIDMAIHELSAQMALRLLELRRNSGASLN